MEIHDLYFEDEQDYINTLNELIDKYEKSLAETLFTESILIIEALKIMLKQFTDKSKYKNNVEQIGFSNVNLSSTINLNNGNSITSILTNPINIRSKCGEEYFRTNVIGFEHDKQEHKRGLL